MAVRRGYGRAWQGQELFDTQRRRSDREALSNLSNNTCDAYLSQGFNVIARSILTSIGWCNMLQLV